MYLKRYIRSINNRFHRSSRLKIDLSYINGVSNRKFRLGREFNDPHSLALKKSRFNEPCFSKDVLSNELCNYINAIKQKSASDILCIDNSKYKTFPYWAAPLPWQDCSIDTNFINFRKNIEKNKRRNIKKVDQDLSNLHNSYGISHSEQYIELHNSIITNGYSVSKFGWDALIPIELLISGDKVVWKPTGNGNHRSILLSYLGYTNIPCVVMNIVNRDCVNQWFNVNNNDLSVEQALSIFDDYINATI